MRNNTINHPSTENGILEIHNWKSTVNSYIELLSPIQLTLEYCHGILPDDFINILMLSPEQTFYYRTDAGTSLTKFNARPLHRHNFYELMIILEGEVYQQIEGNDYQYSTGTCCLIDRNTKHREKFSGEAKLLFIGLSADFIRQLLIEQTGYYFKNECLADNSIFRFIMDNISSEEQKNYLDIFPSFQNQNSIVRLHSLSDKLLHLMMSPSLGATYGIKSIVCELLEYLNDETLFHITPVKLKTKSDFLLFSRISHLLEDTDGDLSRSELADLLNYSGNYLNSIVKKYTGMCLYDYSLTFRLKKAAYLLTTTTDSISSMALKLNFSNKTHFYNLFKKKYGMSPGEYRKLSAFSDI